MNVDQVVLGVLIGIGVAWLWTKFGDKLKTKEAELDEALDRAEEILVCDVKVYYDRGLLPLEYTEVASVSCPKRDCIIRTREGEAFCIHGWIRVEVTPWRKYVAENLEELAAVLVGEDVKTPEPTDPAVDAMLDAPIILSPVISPEDPLAKVLVELEDGHDPR